MLKNVQIQFSAGMYGIIFNSLIAAHIKIQFSGERVKAIKTQFIHLIFLSNSIFVGKYLCLKKCYFSFVLQYITVVCTIVLQSSEYDIFKQFK